MKRFLTFIGGFVVGILATIFVLYIIITIDEKTNNEEIDGLTIFSKKSDCIKTDKEIVIIQVIEPNMALATTGNFINGIVVLLVNYDGNAYYDQQKIKVPSDKCARQIGTYQYNTLKDNIRKTVPAVVIE